jgi:alpha-glucoside transport system permease protein
MGEMAAQSDDRQATDSRSRVLIVFGAILALFVIALGTTIMANRDAHINLLAFIYELLGNTQGADDLRSGIGDQLPAKVLFGVVGIAIGVGAIWLFYIVLSAIVGLLRPRWQERLIPWVFTVPALLLLGIWLVYPMISTIAMSFTEGTRGDPLTHYREIFSPQFIGILQNNVTWLIVGTIGSVGLGLLIAGLVDRVKYESVAKTFIFLPLAISLVGASVIWRFVYQWKPEGTPQIGLLNAVVTALGFDPVRWIQTPPINTYMLIVILIWLQTGFAMVVLSAAIKGVSTEIIEAARLDGASERQVFTKIIVPMIKGSIITVATTIAIVVLKVFDIVYVMTGGNFGTDVVANRMFLEMFSFFNEGRAAALATLLFIAVLPIMFVNIRNLRRQGIGA